MQIGTELIRELRERTGAGIMDCKHHAKAPGTWIRIMDCKLVLEQFEGSLEKAEEALREKGIAKAGSKADRVTSEGLIESYIHAGGRIGAIVEINCETDFVARTPEFRELIHNVAMQIAAMSPRFLSKDQLPEGTDLLAQEVCLQEQPFIVL